MISLLILLSVVLFLTFTFGGLGTNLLVILLESGKILTGLTELTFLHTFTNVPVNKGTLGVHQIELVVKTREDLSDGGRVGDHADGTLDLGKVSSWDDGGWLVVNTTLETGWAPVDELDGTLGLDGSNGGVDVLGDDITTVHEACRHVLSVTWVTLGHGRGWLERGVGDLGNGELLVVCLLGRDDRGECGKHKVNAWVWDEVGLELRDINVQGTVETEGRRERRDDLCHQSVKVGVRWSLNVEGATADVVHGFVVEHDGNVSVLEKRVGRQHRVVWLNNGSCDLWGWVDGEAQFGLATVVDGETLQKERSKTGSSTTTNGIEAHESLETSAVIREFAKSVENKVDNLLANGVVTTGVVVGSIFLTGDDLLWVEQLAVRASADLVGHGWLQINEDATGDVLSGTSFGEKGVEGVVATTDSFVGWHLSVRLNTVLKAVELPAGVTDLETGLANVN